MGTWGTEILSNDTSSDIYAEFFDLYNDGLDVNEISKKVIANNQETISDTDDSNNFWFALAQATWECKQLDPELFNRVKEIIETGADLQVWRQLAASKKDIEERKIVLDKFLADLQTERPKAKPRKKKRIHQPVFEKGDCLTFKLENGNYGGAVVLEAINDTKYGQNLIVTTRINQPAKPTKKDFENAEVLVINFGSWLNRPNVDWYVPVRHKEFSHLIEFIDNIAVEANYEEKTSMFGSISNLNIWLIGIADKQFKSEETKARPTNIQTIKEWIKKEQ